MLLLMTVSCQRCRPLSARACRVKDLEMDDNSCDFEFFDFENATEEEIKEIRAILKGPGSNGSVELPWETSLKEAPIEIIPDNEGELAKETTQAAVINSKPSEVILSPAIPYTSQHAPVSPAVARLPPALETYIAPPTTVGPYPNPPYFVSRTIPYLRAYPHMGVPFFACPIPGAAGENSPLPSPYGQFVPVVPATVAQDKYVGTLEGESNQKSRSNDKQFNKRSKKKSSSDYSSSSYESETVDAYKESMPLEEQTLISSTMPTSISNERPTSVPLVPLPVPPSTFAVAGGTLPLHSYPPGLHTLPYTQMSAPQAPSAAMYYVPVFNHPYGSYIPSPPSAPMVLPVSLQPETSSPVNISSVNLELVSPPVSLSKPVESTSHVQSNVEQVSSEQYVNYDEVKPSIDSAAKNISEGEDVTDCNSSSDYPMSKSVSSSPDCIPDTGITDDCFDAGLPANEDFKQAGRDSSRCWADLFKKPCPEVNGIDSHPSSQQRHESNTLKDVVNGKVYIPASDIH